MKDNFNIEELFKDKFDSFESEVSPDLWANIQQGINAPGAGTAAVSASKTGLSILAKTAIITGGLLTAGIAGYYFYPEETPTENLFVEHVVPSNPSTISEDIPADVYEMDADVIHVQNENDPIIHQNKASIEKELREENRKTDSIGNLDKSDINNKADKTVNPSNNKSSDKQNGNNKNVTVVNDNNIIVEDPKVDAKVAPDKKVIDQDLPTGRMTYSTTEKSTITTYTFSANASNYNSIKWELSNGKTFEGETLQYCFASPGKYQVKMIVIGDSEIYEEVQEIKIEAKSSIDNLPNVITPNGDRINDYFEIESTEIVKFYIVITDQSGQSMFESSDVDFRWNGTDMSGNQLDVGTYRYMIVAEGSDGSVFKLPGAIHIQK
ncbi:T9SS type B sorting domain-containing protein [Crocinitomix catalasitica]|uniref:T9SS type B sorting domain-containing protein n=1 Tax=Crocinitomix catalasitica TaxID=184607 RepID=UPI000488553B|nr:gliding motility-associated C-terminal domain-containing protein [Crocinitomix catalasitica]